MTAIRLHKTVQGRAAISSPMPNGTSSLRRKCCGFLRPVPMRLGRFASSFERIAFRLELLRYEYPHEPVPYGGGRRRIGS